MTPGGRVGAVIMDVHRAAHHGGEKLDCRRVTAGWRIEFLGRRRNDPGRVVGHRDVERVARIDVQGRVLQAARRHEAEQLPPGRVGGRLIGELDVQNAVLAEQRRRLLDHAAGRKSLTGLGDRGDCARRPGACRSRGLSHGCNYPCRTYRPKSHDYGGNWFVEHRFPPASSDALFSCDLLERGAPSLHPLVAQPPRQPAPCPLHSPLLSSQPSPTRVIVTRSKNGRSSGSFFEMNVISQRYLWVPSSRQLACNTCRLSSCSVSSAAFALS